LLAHDGKHVTRVGTVAAVAADGGTFGVGVVDVA
jgi:hypothetical protein